MVKNRMRFFAYPILTSIIMISFISYVSIYVFSVSYEPFRAALLGNKPFFVLWTLAFLVSCIVFLIWGFPKLLVVIKIDDTGIYKSFLGRFLKVHMAWNEIAEVGYLWYVSEQLIFSKSKKLTSIPVSQLHKLNDAIFMGLSKKRYAVIKQYLQQPIVGMSDKVKARLERYKKK